MPPKGKKATSKTAKRPRDSPDSQSEDDFKCNVPPKPEEKILCVVSDEDSASSDQDEQQARESVQKMLQELQGDLTKSYLAKRKQFRQDVNTSTDVLNKKLQKAFKTQQMERQMLRSKYSEMFGPLFQQWEKDVLKLEEEEVTFVNATRQHAEILHKSAVAQKATIDEAKKISDEFLQSIKVLEENHQRLDAIERNRVEKELENLKMKLTTEKQHQDLTAIETCLRSLLCEDYEEKL